MLKWLSKIGGDPSEREIKRLRPTLAQINALEEDYRALSAEELRDKTAQLRARFQEGESLDDLLPEAFAAVREAAWRTIGKRHYDEQMLAGAVLHSGRIAEMKTGEGKTLVATLPLYLNAIEGKGAHLVTTNDYLAKTARARPAASTSISSIRRCSAPGRSTSTRQTARRRPPLRSASPPMHRSAWPR